MRASSSSSSLASRSPLPTSLSFPARAARTQLLRLFFGTDSVSARRTHLVFQAEVSGSQRCGSNLRVTGHSSEPAPTAAMAEERKQGLLPCPTSFDIIAQALSFSAGAPLTVCSMKC